MNNKSIVIAVFSAALIVGLAALLSLSPSVPPVNAGDMDLLARGEYLVQITGCNDCHTPKVFTEKGPVLDGSRLLSGHPSDLPLPSLTAEMIQPGGWVLLNSHLTAAAGPWGVSFAVNLTPDPETGLGRWTEEAFVQSMRTGLHWGVGPAILPPMPWQNLAAMADEDLKAIFAYLQSIKAIRNEVPGPVEFADLSR